MSLRLVYRRDGIGSHWFDESHRAACLRLFPRHPHYAERCYWSGDDTSVFQFRQSDPRFGSQWNSWRDVDATAIQDALDHHANTFDLRTGEVSADLPPGTYALACAILNTRRDSMPDLQLASTARRTGPWYRIGRVAVR